VLTSGGIVCTKADVDPHVASDGPAPLLQALQECCDAGLSFRIVRGRGHEHAYAPHPVGLLRTRSDRPRRRAKQRDELAALHSITSSARTSKAVGTVRSRALAVLRLMISSIFVNCTTGRSAGFSPLRMRPV
jgi:hypothetical protein